MPRNVRNFWIEAEVDGRKTPIAFGPRSADGGFRLTVYMRKLGDIETAIEMEGFLNSFGELVLRIDHKEGIFGSSNPLFEIIQDR